MTEIELQDVHGVHHSNSLTRIRQILCTSAHSYFKQNNKYVEEYRTEEINTKLYLPTVWWIWDDNEKEQIPISKRRKVPEKY